MTRSQLDSRNSADRDLTIFERTVHLYNNPNWKPTSFAFPDLHEKFNIPMNLSLPEDADQLTPENAKKQLCDLLSQYKKSDANWRQSGNGKGNKATSGQRVRVRLTGTQYTADPIQGASDEDPVEEYSDEDDGCRGLGIISGKVKKIKSKEGIRVPNIGWRKIHNSNNSNLFLDIEIDPIFYFVHSYACDTVDKKFVTGVLNYGQSFDVMIEADNVFGTQFHPEKSQLAGLQILKNFYEDNSSFLVK